MRTLKLLLIGAVLAAAAASFAAFVLVDRLVAYGVEVGGEKVLGLPTTVEGAELSFGSGTLVLRGLTIMRADGSERLLYVRRVLVRGEISSVLHDPVKIKELSIHGPEFTYGPDMNLGLPGPEKRRPQKSARGGKERRVTVAILKVTGGKVLFAKRGQEFTIPMPDIVIKDLGGARGLSPSEITAVIMDSMTGSASRAASRAESLGKKIRELRKRFFR